MEVANVKTESLIEQMLSSENLNEAFLQVKRNKGAEGIDGMKVNELSEYLKTKGDEIKEQIRKRKYKPQAVRRWRCKKLRSSNSNRPIYPTGNSTSINTNL